MKLTEKGSIQYVTLKDSAALDDDTAATVALAMRAGALDDK